MSFRLALASVCVLAACTESAADAPPGAVDSEVRDATTDAPLLETGIETEGGGEVADAADAADVTSADCLPSVAMDAYFTLADPSAWCLVANYTVPEPRARFHLTWGRHGGPLGVDGWGRFVR